MPPKEWTSKKPLPNATESTPSTCRRGAKLIGKVAEPTAGEAGTQKWKAKDFPPVDQPTKRANTRGSKAKQIVPPLNTKEVTEPTPRMNNEAAKQTKTHKTKTIIKSIPTRPILSSDSKGEEDDLQNGTIDGNATSPVPSNNEVDELPTATQLTTEVWSLH
ncbi:hypothetical protein BDM02DRAFT_3185140 [Thelephora ganbajun]|uniref:Uncharacterized protein n=1 Tax=Thelephora ganbajun TaxID=370292 RepID=A0ACB6ZMJ3_THEGA|nr:hypothetical protein BDM02DRAFT_3185140 [Thelephora ganbajun]